jgi:hypothetical protein
MGWEYSEDASTAYPPDVWVCDACGHRIENAKITDPFGHEKECSMNMKSDSASEVDW